MTAAAALATPIIPEPEPRASRAERAERRQIVTLRAHTNNPQSAAYLPYLQAWRERLGWSREELWHRSGVWPRTIRAYERGERPCSFGQLHKLATAMGIPNATLADEHPAAVYADAAAHPIPTTRVQALARGDGSSDSELVFYLPALFGAICRAAYARGVENDAILRGLCAATHLSAARLGALVACEVPAPWRVVCRLARALGLADALALVTYWP